VPRFACLFACVFALAAGPLAADDNTIVFHSDIALGRVDAQVLDSANRAITHLQSSDFVLRLNGRDVPIRNFASDNMPIDVLFLLDVSASMRPHVQRIADASGQALTVLGKNDRMAIMVFDRYTRVRLPFNADRQQVQRGFDRLLRDERFNGGTDITRGMFDAIDYIGREGRRDARRAIIILTDDQTELDRDDIGVGRALANANTIMCALIAPYAEGPGGGRGGGRNRGGWGGGPGIGGPLGGIIFGRGGGYPGGGYPGGGYPSARRSDDHSAGTAEIARDSGGDSMSVDDASALQDTLERLRQRYTLYFNLPEGAQPGEARNIRVDLSQEARLRYRDAEVRYRRTSMASQDAPTPVRVTRAPSDGTYSTPDVPVADSSTPPAHRRRVAVNEDGSAISSSSGDGSGPGTGKP
jgi:VWFA-related protein